MCAVDKDCWTGFSLEDELHERMKARKALKRKKKRSGEEGDHKEKKGGMDLSLQFRGMCRD